MQAAVARPVDPADATYELFRRAVCEADAAAWTEVAITVRPVVLAAIRMLAGGSARDDAHDWVHRALDRFWRAVPAERFAEFGDAPSLLRYVKMCAASVYLDSIRDQRRHATVELEWAANSAVDSDIEQDVIDNDAARDLWAEVQALLKDDDERLLAELSFVRGMTPREIHAAAPRRFGSIADVYQAKRRILERLRPRLARRYSSLSRC